MVVACEMASSILILDSKGSPIIQRSFRGDVTINLSQVFVRRVVDEEESAIAPVFEHEGHTFVVVRYNDIFLVAVGRVNFVPLLYVAYLNRIIDVFKSYFSEVTEESLRDNFVIIYELLDETMDFGFPQLTETNVLKEYITQEGFRLQLFDSDEQIDVKPLPAAATGVNGAIEWRPLGIKHRKNEVFLDVVETINVLLNYDGEVLQSEIAGALKMKVKLSGMPDVKLGVNDKLALDASRRMTGAGGPNTASPGAPPATGGGRGKVVELEDIRFHQCVKLSKFQADRTISFIPPEGDFDLMTYRIPTHMRPLVQCEVQVVRHGTSRVEMALTLRSTYKKMSLATFIDVLIPVPVDASKPTGTVTAGTLGYQPERESAVWSLRNFPGMKEAKCKCQYTLPSVRVSDPSAFSKRPIVIKFEIPYFTASGFQVRYLRVTEKSNYETSPWVRYVTQSGEYHVRTN